MPVGSGATITLAGALSPATISMVAGNNGFGTTGASFSLAGAAGGVGGDATLTGGTGQGNHGGYINLNTGGGSSSGAILFQIAGTEAARVDASGYFGIGTTLPSTALTVQGATNYGVIKVLSAAPGGEASIGFRPIDGTDGGVNDWVIGSTVNGSGNNFVFWNQSNNLITIDPSGNMNLAFGGLTANSLTTPTLQVNGLETIVGSDNGFPGNGLVIVPPNHTQTATYGWGGITTSSIFVIQTGGGQNLYLNPSFAGGFVGIGIDPNVGSPLGPLQVRAAADINLLVNAAAGALTLSAINDVNSANVPFAIRASSLSLDNGAITTDGSGNATFRSVAISTDGSPIFSAGYDLKIRSTTSLLGIHTDYTGGIPTLEFGCGDVGTIARITTNGSTNPIVLSAGGVDSVLFSPAGQVGLYGNNTSLGALDIGGNLLISTASVINPAPGNTGSINIFAGNTQDSAAVAGNINIAAGAANTNGASGGNVSISGGYSVGGVVGGPSLTLYGAQGNPGTQVSGAAAINGGTNGQGDGGAGILLNPGNGSIGGGSVNISAGSSASRPGGDIILSPGVGSTTGHVQILDGSQGVGKVLTSDASGNASWQASAGFAIGSVIATYITGVQSSAFATFDGVNMWVSGQGSSGTLAKISPDGVSTVLGGIGSYPYGQVFDGKNIWVLGNNAETIIKVEPNGTTTPYPLPINNPIFGAFDGTNIWVTDGTSNAVVKVAPDGTPTAYTGAVSNPYGIAFDGQNMWVANSTDGSVSKIDPSGVMTNYPIPGVSQSYGIAFDGANMWVTSPIEGAVTEVAPDGSVIATYFGIPGAIWIAFDGTNMWVVSNTVGDVTRVAPDGSFISYPGVTGFSNGIAFDGQNMWVVGGADNTISEVQALPHFYRTNSPSDLTGFALASSIKGAPSSSATVAVPISSVTTYTVTHNLGYYPLVQILNSSGFMVIPNSLFHTDMNNFTVTFTLPVTGTIIYR